MFKKYLVQGAITLAIVNFAFTAWVWYSGRQELAAARQGTETQQSFGSAPAVPILSPEAQKELAEQQGNVPPVAGGGSIDGGFYPTIEQPFPPEEGQPSQEKPQVAQPKEAQSTE